MVGLGDAVGFAEGGVEGVELALGVVDITYIFLASKILLFMIPKAIIESSVSISENLIFVSFWSTRAITLTKLVGSRISFSFNEDVNSKLFLLTLEALANTEILFEGFIASVTKILVALRTLLPFL